MFKKIILVGLLLSLILLLPSKAFAVDSAYITNGHLVFALTYRNNTPNEYLQIGHYDFLPGGSLTAHYYFYNAGVDRGPTSSGKKNLYQLNYPSGQACNNSEFALPTWEGLMQKSGNWSFDSAGNKITISLDNIGVFNWTLQDEPTQYYALSGISSMPQYANHSIGFAYLTKSPVVTSQPLDRNSLYDVYSGVLYQNNGHATADWAYYPQGMSFAPYQAPYDADILNYGYPCDGGMYCGYHYLLNNNPYTKNIYYQRNGHDFNRDLCMDLYGHSSILFGTLENGKIARSVTLEYSSPGDGYPIISVGSWYAPAAFLSPTPTPTLSPTQIPTPTSTPLPTNTPTPTPTPVPVPGDITGSNGVPDRKVDIYDYNQLVTDFGKTGIPGWILSDINRDGKVNIFDYNILVTNFGYVGKLNGQTCSAGSECTSGFCTEGVCCNTACTGSTCQRCDSYSNAGAGTCGYVSNSSADPDNECTASLNACSGNTPIGPDGNCSGTGYSCKTTGNTGSACATAGTCQTGGGCSAGSCVSVSNVANGSQGPSCTATHYVCNGSGSCTAPTYQYCNNWPGTGVSCSTQCAAWYDGASCYNGYTGSCTTYTGPVGCSYVGWYGCICNVWSY